MLRYGFFINQRTGGLDVALNAGCDAFTIISANPLYIDIIKHIKEVNPNAKVVVRYYQAPAPIYEDPRAHARACYYNHFLAHAMYTTRVYPMNEPQIEVDGLDFTNQIAVADMWIRLNTWMLAWVDEFKTLCPDAFVIFPPPAPGWYWDDNKEVDGLTRCAPAIAKCNAVAQNCYWSGPSGAGLYTNGDQYAFRYRETARRTGKPIWISEFNGVVQEASWPQQVAYYLKEVSKDAYVIGASCFLLDAHDGQFPDHDVALRPDLASDLAIINEALKEPEPVPVLPISLEAAAREIAWNAKGIPYNSEAAFAKHARAHALGAPETQEFDFTYLDVSYRGQGFTKGFVYAKVGDWDNINMALW